MSIHFSPERWDKVRANYTKFWAGELDRPLLHITTVGYESDRMEPELPCMPFASFYEDFTTPEEIVDRGDYELSTCRFLGDAFPQYLPSFGPGGVPLCLGCDARKGNNTVWIEPQEEQEIQDIHLEYRTDTYWYNRMMSIYKAAAERWQGEVQLAHTDLGGNLDNVAVYRPSEKLMYDFYDNPDDVKRLAWELHDCWWKYFQDFIDVMGPTNPGHSAWLPMWSPDPFYVLQNDAGYMMGPEMFDEFALPELSKTAERLGHSVYHLDGVGQLAHMDSMCSIPGLDAIQWVMGDGQPDAKHWPEVYKQIRDGGKFIEISGGHSDDNYRVIELLDEILGSAEGIFVCAKTNKSNEADVIALLDKYGIEHGLE